MGQFVSIFIPREASSALLLSVVESLLFVHVTGVMVKGPGWWPGRSVFSLVAHELRIG